MNIHEKFNVSAIIHLPNMEEKNIPPILAFPTSRDFRKWLSKNFKKEEGIWLRMYKKSSGVKSINWAEAVDAALCYGWIDGQSKSYDEHSWIQKITPRRKRSMWSKNNIEHVARLIKTKKMRAPGLAEVKRAKEDGRWKQAYASPANMKTPSDFIQELQKHKKGYTFFEGLNKANKYAIAWQLHHAKKPETRARRLKKFLEMMKKGEKLY